MKHSYEELLKRIEAMEAKLAKLAPQPPSDFMIDVWCSTFEVKAP